MTMDPDGAQLQERFQTAIRSLYADAEQTGTDGARHAVDPHTRIAPQAGQALIGVIGELKPRQTLEIGCAYGFSTLFIAAALAWNGGERHTAVDPFQTTLWHGIGAQKIAEVGLADRFRLIEELSDYALPLLAKQDERFQLIMIDGDHRFDAIIADIRNADRILDVGGVLVLDDLVLPATQAALGFLLSNLAYERLPVDGGNVGFFRKTGPDERHWSHFVPFPMPAPRGA